MSRTSPMLSLQSSLSELVGRLDSWDSWPKLLESLRRGDEAVVSRATGAAGAWLVAALYRSLAAPVVIVCREPDRIDDWGDDLQLFGIGDGCGFPAWETACGDRSPLDDIYRQRLTTLRQLVGDASANRIIVTTAASLLQPVPSPVEFQEGSRTLAVGDRVAPDELIAWLTRHDFHATPAVALPGEFSVRGGIVDVFPLDAERPVRLEWFDVEIESMRVFDVETQRSMAKIDALSLFAWREDDSAQASLFDYLPARTWLYFEDLAEVAATWQRLGEQSETEMAWLAPQQIGRRIADFGRIDSVPTGRHRGDSLELPVESVERFTGEVGRVREELERAAAGSRIYLLAETDAERTRLEELLADSTMQREGRLQLEVGRISGGFRCRTDDWLLLSSSELFQRTQVHRVSRLHRARPLEDYLELRSGQLVVHLGHGIARYHGLEIIDKEGAKEEHLVLEFAGGTRLFVPAAQIELVQKYIGGTKRTPRLATLGGRQWSRQKASAAASVEDLAAEMLELQAERTLRQGIAFDPDSEWQREFDASFPYVETEDQLQAIGDIKHDMETARPMDRLLCGDVGFGKTEVAMRAAFKAVESGHQVAILVPTTILAEQHYQTFRQRMAEFPIDVAKLSRFCTTGETREVLAGLKAGRIDIVIGTHRLASRDVRFHNLGLVMIDEEQRFGVEVKERLKSLKSTVDVLTMTATPIPRTLHMALVGVRDISTLHTPPEDRTAVETRVVAFDESLIRQAVLRELNRGGQIYFVHNRIEDIELLSSKLQRIVPEARIGIGHGRLPEHELERVMVGFVEHRFDLLLATTIVESGLDIPNANTMFIDDADRYGLADLHQLRGRVGRYKHRAFCYLLVDPSKLLTPNAARRLRAIEEYSELGAGFQLAMRDLEIRGAGNLLGTQQSGHIAAVGYELYCQMLESAVRRLKQIPDPKRLEVDIQLPGDAYLPASYVQDMRLKMELYRRLARLDQIPAIESFRDELVDRFGELPPQVERLLWIAELRIDAAIWQIEAIWIEQGKYLGMRYGDRGRIETLVKRSDGKLRVVDGRSIYATIPQQVDSPAALLGWVKSVLQCG